VPALPGVALADGSTRGKDHLGRISGRTSQSGGLDETQGLRPSAMDSWVNRVINPAEGTNVQHTPYTRR
jgi:hypothetical protein